MTQDGPAKALRAGRESVVVDGVLDPPTIALAAVTFALFEGVDRAFRGS